MTRKLTDGDISEMREMKAQGLSDLTISLDFDCAPATVWKYTRGVPRVPRGPQGPKRFAEMAADRLAGMSCGDVAVKYGYASGDSVSKVLSRFASVQEVRA